MSERLVPWRAKPSQEVLSLLCQVAEAHCCYLVHRSGPTSFVVRDQGADVKRRVSIGARMTCTCDPIPVSGMPTSGQPVRELCLHTLFVLVKVLRVPPSNPLVWQLSLTDRELEEALRCSILPQLQPKATKSRRHEGGTDDQANGIGVKRRTVEEEEPCPICYDGMAGAALEMLVWCSQGCGHNVHGKCMGVWADHQIRSLGKELTCPMCRTEWGEFKWKPPPQLRRKIREARTDVHLGTQCNACKKAPLTGKRYCCLVCADLDLCDTCFQAGNHLQHTFAVRDGPTGPVAAAHRAAMMPTATGLLHSARSSLIQRPPRDMLQAPRDLIDPPSQPLNSSRDTLLPSSDMLQTFEHAAQRFEDLQLPLDDLQLSPAAQPHQPFAESGQRPSARRTSRTVMSAAGAAAELRHAAMLGERVLQPEALPTGDLGVAQQPTLSFPQQPVVGATGRDGVRIEGDDGLSRAHAAPYNINSAAAAVQIADVTSVSNAAVIQPIATLAGRLSRSGGELLFPPPSIGPSYVSISAVRATEGGGGAAFAPLVTSLGTSAGPARLQRGGSGSFHARAAERRRMVLTAPAYDDLMRVLEGRAAERGVLQIEGHHADGAAPLPPTSEQQEQDRVTRVESGSHVRTLQRLRRSSLPSITSRQLAHSGDGSDLSSISIAGLACNDQAIRQRHASHDGGQANTTQDHPSQPPQLTDRPPQPTRRQSAGPKYAHGSPQLSQHDLPPQSVGFRKGSVRPLPSRHVPTDLAVRRESTHDFLQGVLVVNGQMQNAAPAPPIVAPGMPPARTRSSLRRGSLTSLPLPGIASAAVQELCRLAEAIAAQPDNGDDPLELLTVFAGAATGRSHAEELYAYDVDYASWQQHKTSTTSDAGQGLEAGGENSSEASHQAYERGDDGSPSRCVMPVNGCAFTPAAINSLGRSPSTRIPGSGLRARAIDRLSSSRFEPDEQEQETGWPTSLPALSAGPHTCLYQETRRDRALETFVETAARREANGDGTLLPVRSKKPGLRNKKKTATLVAPPRYVSSDIPAHVHGVATLADLDAPVPTHPETTASIDPEAAMSINPTANTSLVIERSSSTTADPDFTSRTPSPESERVFWSHMYSNPVFDRPYSSLDVG